MRWRRTTPSLRSTWPISRYAPTSRNGSPCPRRFATQIMSVSGLPGAKFWGKNFFDTAEEGVIERAKAGNYELNRYQVPPDAACALDQARRRTDLGGVGQEDGRQGPQGRPRHPQHRARFAQELGPDPAHRISRETVTVLHSIEKWLWRCELVLVYAGVLAAFAMMCLTSADALSRYLLNRPIIGAYEITEKYLMVATIFLGLSYRLSRRRVHPRDLPGRPAACADEAAGAISRAPGVAAVLSDHPRGDDATGGARAERRHHAERTAAPGRPGLLASFRSGFLALTVIMLIDLRAFAAVGRTCSGKRHRPPDGERRARPLKDRHGRASAVVLLVLALVLGVPIAVALAGCRHVRHLR